MKHLTLFITTLVFLSGAAGCGTQRAQPMPGQTHVAPVVRGSDNGLEVRWWAVAGAPEGFGARLHEWEQAPVRLDPQTRDLWASHGLRVIAVPLDELPALKERFRFVSGAQRQWFGQVPFWTEMVRGPTRNAGQLVALDRERLALTAGTLRLLVRAWTAPSAGTDEMRPEMHIEIVPQHHELHSSVDPEAMLGLTARPREPERQGLLFSRLHATLTSDDSVAYIIVPEAPATEWTDEIEEPEPVVATRAPTTGGPGLGEVVRSVPARLDEPPAPPVESESVGPPSMRVPTLGEAMLAARRPRDVREEVRVLVVLIPRIPDHYSLIR